jgi:hypothetical protein
MAWLHSHEFPNEHAQEPAVVGFMGAINGIIVDDDAVPDWLIVEDDGTMGCKVCTCPIVTVADHEQEKDHFHAHLLHGMELYFDRLKVIKEDATETEGKENGETVPSPKRDYTEGGPDRQNIVGNTCMGLLREHHNRCHHHSRWSNGQSRP